MTSGAVVEATLVRVRGPLLLRCTDVGSGRYLADSCLAGTISTKHCLSSMVWTNGLSSCIEEASWGLFFLELDSCANTEVPANYVACCFLCRTDHSRQHEPLLSCKTCRLLKRHGWRTRLRAYAKLRHNCALQARLRGHSCSISSIMAFAQLQHICPNMHDLLQNPGLARAVTPAEPCMEGAQGS